VTRDSVIIDAGKVEVPQSESSQSLKATALQGSDADLWTALKQGQVEMLGILYDRHVGLVYAIALRVLQNSQDAEDLTQDIFLRLSQTNYDPQRGSLRTFLAVLTRSRGIDRLRSKQRSRTSLARLQAEQPHAWMDTSTDALADTAQRQKQSQQVEAALSALSDNQRQVLHLAYQEGMTQAAIANQLGMPLGTVKAWARRGLIKLRQTLQTLSEE